jgi:archaellum biogenesis ATPase FlaH
MEDNSIQKIRDELAKRSDVPRKVSAPTTNPEQLSDEVVHIKDAATLDGKLPPAIPIGFNIIDDALMGGIRLGDFIIITGISGRGKTLFCQNISVNLSTQDKSIIFFSYEMNNDEIYGRFKEMNIDDNLMKVYVPKNLTSGGLEWIETKIVEGINKFDTRIVVIDHLDFIFPKNVNKSSIEHKRMIFKDACMELKNIAMKLNVAIFLVAHVKKVQFRSVELQDIAETSGAHQLANIVFAIDRYSEVKVISGKKTETFPNNEGTIRMLKNRWGSDLPILNFYIDNKIIKVLEDMTVVKNYYESDKDDDTN